MNILQSVSFGKIFLLLEGGGFVVKLVAAEAIRQHVFFFSLLYFFDKKIW